MKHSLLCVYEKVIGLRASAAALYDELTTMGLSKVQVSSEVRGVSEALSNYLYQAVRQELGPCVVAITQLEEGAEAYEHTILMLKKKQQADRDIANLIKLALLDRLHEEKKEALADGSFIVTKSVGPDGKPSVSVR